MENEEKEDLLLEVTESDEEPYEKEEIDYYFEKKILEYIQSEKPNRNSSKKTLILITACLFMFLSSSVLITTLPIYLKYSSVINISTYSKLVTLSLTNSILFVIAHVVGVLFKCGSHASHSHNLCLGDVLKVSFLLSVGSVAIFWLADDNYVSCHLKDPLKGCSSVFSLLFYFLFSRKKMSLERTFCAITIIVGVFVSVDFGICDKFQCNGNPNIIEVTPKLHFLYVILYLLAHGVWVLHFTFIEVCWTTLKDSNSNLNISVVSNVSSNLNPELEVVKPSIQSLSIICQEEEQQEVVSKNNNFSKFIPNKNSFLNSKFFISKTPNVNESDDTLKNSGAKTQLSVPDFNKFPVTSTPNNELNASESWTSGQCYDIALWQHVICCLLVLGLCWVPTISFFHNGKGKLLVDVINELFQSFCCHTSWSENPKCDFLPIITILVSVSYVILMLSSIELLKTTQSAITVVAVMMPALPVASLFWSLFQISNGSGDILEFNPEITGEAVCAILGLPIVGIGIVLLVKSHIREFNMEI